MTHRRLRVTRIFGSALGAALASMLLWSGSASAAFPCFGFFCRTTTTTTSTQTSSSSTSTATSTATTTVSSTTTSSTSAGGLPTITEIPPGSGSHGYPYDTVPATPTVVNAPSIDLASDGYVEREFTMSGADNIYQQAGSWGSDGNWGVSVSQKNVPYKTRLLVRYPTDPAQFNGTVVIEWLNDTTGGDQDPAWAQIYNTVLANGYAYIGVTAQTPGMIDLATWDPARYGTLGDTNDGQSYDIFTQAAQVARADTGGLLGGLAVKKVLGIGDSQSAIRMDTYVNAINPLVHAFDGFLTIGRAVVAAPLGAGLVSLTPFPAKVRTDNTTPFIQLNTQGDILELDAGAARQPDNNDLRTWELTGASHIDSHEAEYEIETIATENPTLPVPACAFGTPISGTGTALDGVNQTNNMPLFEAEDAALVALNNWVTNGTPPPHSPQIATTSLFGLFDIPQTNQYGIANGGIRMPEAQVPTEDYSPINFSSLTSSSLNPVSLLSELEGFLSAAETGSLSNPAARVAGLCLLSGYFTDLGNSALTALYPTTAAYAAKFTAAANADVAAGFMTPADAQAAIGLAQAGIGPLQEPPVHIP